MFPFSYIEYKKDDGWGELGWQAFPTMSLSERKTKLLLTHTHTHRIWDYRQDVVARTTKFAPFNIASSSTMSFRKGNFTKWLRNCLRRACPCTLTDVLPLPLFLVGGAFPDFHSSLMMRYFVVMPLFLYIFWFFFSLTIFQQQKIVIFLKTFEISLKMLSSPQHDQNQGGPPVCETWWKLFGKQCHTHKQSPRLVTGPATCTRWWWWWLIVGNLWDFSLLVRVVLQYNSVVLVCPGGGLVA